MNNRKKGSLPQLRVSRQVRAKTLRLWGVYLLALLAWVAVAIVLTEAKINNIYAYFFIGSLLIIDKIYAKDTIFYLWT